MGYATCRPGSCLSYWLLPLSAWDFKQMMSYLEVQALFNMEFKWGIYYLWLQSSFGFHLVLDLQIPNHGTWYIIWVVIKIMVAFWVLSILGDPTGDHNFDNQPCSTFYWLARDPALWLARHRCCCVFWT